MQADHYFQSLLTEIVHKPYEVIRDIFKESGFMPSEAQLCRVVELYSDVRYLLFAPAQELSLLGTLDHKQAKILRNPYLNALYEVKEWLRIKPVHLNNLAFIRYSQLLVGYQPLESGLVYFLDEESMYISHHLHAIGWKDELKIISEKLISEAIALGAKQLIMVHNHPSGNVEPSTSDMMFHKQFKDQLCEHGLWSPGGLIVSQGEYENYTNKYVDDYLSVFR